MLLYAALVSSLLLAIGIAVFNINKKELLLSSTARESQVAFFAADVGTECALYHDFQNNAFNIVSPSGSVDCVGSSNPVDTSAGDSNASDPDAEGTYIREFSLDIDGDGPFGPCALVTVIKDVDSGGIKTTSIESLGQSSCDSTNQRRVERAIRTLY